jgi:hypothetical protein
MNEQMCNLGNPIYKPRAENETNQAKFRQAQVPNYHCQMAFFVLQLLSLARKHSFHLGH